MAHRSSGLDLERPALVGATAWVVGASVATATSYLGLFGRSVPAFAFGGVVESAFFLVWQYNGLHETPVAKSLVPVVVITAAGYYAASEARGGFQQGAAIAVGYAGLAVGLELFGVVWIQLTSAIASLDFVALAVRAVAIGVASVVLGGVGGAVYDRHRGTSRDRGRSSQPDPVAGIDDRDRTEPRDGAESSEGRRNESAAFTSRGDRDERR